MVEKNFELTVNQFFDDLCIDALAELSKDIDFDNIDTIIVDEAQLFTEKEILSIESLKRTIIHQFFCLVMTFSF